MPSESGSDSVVRMDVIQENKNWVNIEYIKCASKSCPCGCITGDVDFISFDRLKAELVAYVFNETLDYDLWFLDKSSDNQYDATRNRKDKLASIEMRKDTLVLTLNGVQTYFVNFKELDDAKGVFYVGRQNALLLERSIPDTSSILKKILQQDSTELHCNHELGVNLISISTNCNQRWIVIQKQSELQLYKYLNGCDGKTTKPVFDTVLVEKAYRSQ
jgi:hypothetical protein